MDETTLMAIGVIKAQQQGDEFIWDHEETDDEGITSYGIWKSALDAKEKKNTGRVKEVRDFRGR